LSVTCVDTDYDRLAVTVISDFDASIDRVWELWSDPRKLERWWGPPAYPASFDKHDLTPGGEVTYSMAGEGGDARGTWRVTAVDPPTSLEFTDSCFLAGPDGTPVADMPASRVAVRIAERDGGTRMEIRLTYETLEDLQKVVESGTVEGLQQAVGQMDALLG
jgi:uncharacterized protein YndB with AHSA1/START domain